MGHGKDAEYRASTRHVPPVASLSDDVTPKSKEMPLTPIAVRDRIERLLARLEDRRCFLTEKASVMFSKAEQASLNGWVRVLRLQIESIPTEAVLLGALVRYLDDIERALVSLQSSDPDDRVKQLGAWVYSRLRHRSHVDQRITRVCSFLRNMRDDAELLAIVLEDAGDDVISEWLNDETSA